MHHQQSGSELDKSKRISFSISNILETKSEEEEEELEEEEEDSEEDEEEEEERSRNSSQQLGYLAAISTAAATAVSSSTSSFSSASSAAYLAHLRHRHCTENNRMYFILISKRLFYTVLLNVSSLEELHLIPLCTATEIPFTYSFLGIARPQSHLSVNDLYIPRIGPHISCSRICRSIVGIYNLLTDT
jgi:hypothetical protein